MTWQTPRTWTLAQRITREHMQTELDNLLALFLGEVGGTDSIGPVEVTRWTDQALSPDVTGMMRRNGASLEWRDDFGVGVAAADIPNIVSLVSLAPGGGAPGDHSHSLAYVESGVAGLDTTQTGDRGAGYHNTLSEVSSGVNNVSVINQAVLYVLAIAYIGQNGTVNPAQPGTLRVKVDGVTMASGSGLTWYKTIRGSGGPTSFLVQYLEYTQQLFTAGPFAVDSTHQAMDNDSKSSIIEQRVAAVEL